MNRMTDKQKPALHQFADDLCAAIKSPEFETKTFSEVVAECLEPLIEWDTSLYVRGESATRESPAVCGHFESFTPVEEWAEDVLDSLPSTTRAQITERAHERALENRGE